MRECPEWKEINYSPVSKAEYLSSKSKIPKILCPVNVNACVRGVCAIQADIDITTGRGHVVILYRHLTVDRGDLFWG
jgi:hypothetical protein